MDVPERIASPIALPSAESQIELWSGQAVFTSGDREINGEGRFYLDFVPNPRIRFSFQPTSPLGFLAEFDGDLRKPAQLACRDPIGTVACIVLHVGEDISGYVEDVVFQEADPRRFSAAKFLVLNGPKVSGSAITDGVGFYSGRNCTRVGDVDVIMDSLRQDQNRRDYYRFTHIVQCEFSRPACMSEVDALSSDLFRTLSLMKCRWVGLVGPWLDDVAGSGSFLRASVTKVAPVGNSSSWHHENMRGCFADLLASLFAAFRDRDRKEALETAFHWLLESGQCAGGVEGALILQQAALECLAWLEIVVVRKICSEGGFKNMPAADKIRWLLSLYGISTEVPGVSESLVDYAKAFNHSDMVGVLADVRNVLVHAEPKKAGRLFERVRGDDERSDLWYQVGGVLQQAFLASVGYRGKIRRRDLDVEFATSAIRQVPWAS